MPYKDSKRRKEYNKGYYQKNKNELIKRSRVYRKKHKDHIKKYKQEYHIKNRDEINKKKKKYYEENKDNPEFKSKRKEYSKKWKAKNIDYHNEYSKKWAKNNPENVKLARDKWRNKNKKKTREFRREYEKNRKKTDKNFKIAHSLRIRVIEVLKKYTKTGKTFPSGKYGIDYKAIIEYLEPLPKDYLTSKNKYDLHHKKPLVTFNFVNPDGSTNLKEVKKAFAPKNHIILTKKEHMRIPPHKHGR